MRPSEDAPAPMRQFDSSHFSRHRRRRSSSHSTRNSSTPSASDFNRMQTPYSRSRSGRRGPPDYLVFSILTTIFCCLPFGIIAIVYSVKTRSANKARDMHEAAHCSSQAKFWLLLSAGIGLIFISIRLILAFVATTGGI